MSTRPLLAGTAAASALLLGVLTCGPALAAAPAAPARGVGSSTLTVLNVVAGGHRLTVGGLSLLSDTASGAALAKATITPVVADGIAYGSKEITPANSPFVVPSVTSPGALSGILSVSSAPISASATSAPSSSAGSSSLGTVSLLGINVPLSGSASLGSSVSKTGAQGQKTVSVTNLSLPSIGAILAALGLDVSKLPAGTLGTLVSELNLTNAAIDTAQAAVDAAQVPVTAAAATLAAAQSTAATAATSNTTAQAALTTATSALTTLLALVTSTTTGLYPGANTIPGYTTLSSAGKSAVEADAPGTAAAFLTYTNASTAATAAAAQLATAQAAVNTAQAALVTVTATLTGALVALDGLAGPVLNATPLVSLDNLTVGTTARSASAALSGQTATVTGGTVKGLKVLGTDVLLSALGNTQLAVLDLVGAKAATVTAAINGLTATLSSVLSSVAALPALTFPAPQIGLLTKTTKTWVAGGYGRAQTSVSGLSITLPPVTIPNALALPQAANLPALTGVSQVAGQLTSAPISLGLLSIADESAFRPAVIPAVVPGSQKPVLAKTGMSVGVAALALLLIGGGLLLRRRREVIEG